MRPSSVRWFAALAVVLTLHTPCLSDAVDEFKVKRQEVYEFTESPKIRLDGDPSTGSGQGDEVALFHGAYLATDTDHRLFVADPGNGRVLSVKLGYHATETLPLKGK